MRRSAVLSVFALAAASLAACGAGPIPQSLQPGETARVAEVLDGDSLRLANGLVVRLAEIDAPRVQPGDPLGAQATQALRALVAGKTVTLRYGGLRRDKRGRALAQVFTTGPQGVWLQRELLARGLARVHTWPDNRAEARQLLAAEAAARGARRGLWASAAYGVRAADPNQLIRFDKSFQVVEGVVREAAERRGRVYLNFGDNYRTDFTVSVDPAATRLWPGGAAGVQSLQGKRIRVRGWLSDYNGPSIRASHPEQIEVIGPARA
jgi:micrococcal nuclease